MKIRNKLYIGDAISIVLVIILVVTVILSSNKVAQEMEKHNLLMDTNTAISELDTVTYEYLLHHEKRMEQQWNLRYKSMEEVLEEAVESIRLPLSMLTSYTSLYDSFSQVTANYERSQKLIEEGASQEEIDAAIGLEERLVAQLLITSHSVMTDASRLADESQAELMEAQRLDANLTLILMIVLATVITTSSLLIARSISKPLGELTKGAEIIGKGDLEHKVEVKSKDELGQLAAAFNEMTGSLKEVTASRDELDREVTVRKQMEETLLESEERFRALTESTSDWIWEVDINGVYTYSSPKVNDLLGYKPEEVIGKTPFDLMNPEEAKRVAEEFGAIVGSQRPFAGLENANLHKDGRLVVLETSGVPVFDTDGQLCGYRGIDRDITEHKQAELLVQEAREYAENVIDTVREPLVVLDADLKIITTNHSFYETFNVKQEETEGQLLYDLGNRQWDIPKLRQLLENILPKNTVFQDFEVEHEFERIGRKTMLLNGRRIYRETNKTLMILLAIEDITERKRAEEEILKANTELAAVNKELEAFSYSVSHDLRAPLRSVDGFSQVLLEDYPDKLDEQGKDYLQRVRSASQRMAQLIDDMLKLSCVTRGEMKHETVDLSALARTIVAELKERQPERQVEFAISKGLVVNGDKRLLTVLLENLLDNAWKFTSKHSSARIEFGVNHHGDKPVYFVRDDGVGFDMAYVDRLFGAFQRLHATSEFSGTGIGLATAQRIVHRHGGRAWAEGEVEKGATFYFTLQ